jgi:AcrR family transcriptional regulator
VTVRDVAATRERLLEVGMRLFSERGFHQVTVRELCREAGANLAAVNYHFGGKLGLYREIVTGTFSKMRVDPTLAAPEGASAEERLRHYVRAYLPRLAAPTGAGVMIQKLMRHEMTDPTPLAPWIAEQVILPRLRYLAGAVSELLGADPGDPRVERCVVSVQAECLFYLPSAFRTVVQLGRGSMTRSEIAAAAEHVVEFTLAGIRRVAETRP